MNSNDSLIHYNERTELLTMKPKQYITFIPTNDKNSYAIATSKQYTMELAQRDVYIRLEQANVECKNKVYNRELIVDEDGVIRIVDDNGEIISLDQWKV